MRKNKLLQLIVSLLLLLLLAACGPDQPPEIGVTLIVPTSVSSGGGVTAVHTAAPATSEPINPAATVTIPGDGSGSQPGSGNEGDAAATPGAPTPALQPTARPGASPTPPPTDPETTFVSSFPLPGLSRELLFIGDGALKRWQRIGQVEVLLPGGTGAPAEGRTYRTGDLTRFAVTENGRFLVAARVTATDLLTHTVPHAYEIISLNLDSRETRVVVPVAIGVEKLALAGNGEHLAYLARTNQPPQEPAYGIRVVQTGSSSTRISVPCSASCGGIAWHPDYKNVAWGDESGLWLYNTDGNEPQRLLELATARTSPFVYVPISWAANGRFLLLQLGQSESGERAVFDVPTGQAIPLPGSAGAPGPHQTDVSWMQDNRLLVSRPADPERLVNPPLLEIWRVNPDTGQMVREEMDAMPVLPSGITAPVHLEDGRFGFALTHPTSSSVSGLYILKGFGDTLTRINGALPVPAGGNVTVTWNRDGSGIILQYESGAVLYAPADGGSLFRVDPLLGEWSDAFHWLPPRLP